MLNKSAIIATLNKVEGKAASVRKVDKCCSVKTARDDLQIFFFHFGRTSGRVENRRYFWNTCLK